MRGERASIPEEDRSSPLLLHLTRPEKDGLESSGEASCGRSSESVAKREATLPTRLFVKLGSSERTKSQRSRVRLFEDLWESWEEDIAGGTMMLGEKLNIKSELYSRLRST